MQIFQKNRLEFQKDLVHPGSFLPEEPVAFATWQPGTLLERRVLTLRMCTFFLHKHPPSFLLSLWIVAYAFLDPKPW